MTQLKTLKDLKKPIAILNARDSIEYMKMSKQIQEKMPHYADIKDLRQEAIKWIKEFPSCDELIRGDNLIGDMLNYDCASCSEGVGSCVRDIIIDWIKHFFNISEEDLKE